MFTNPNYTPTTSSPGGGDFSSVWDLYDAIYSGRASDRFSGQIASEANVKVRDAEEARVAEEARIARRAKVRRVQNQTTGGFDFFDGDGNPISLTEFCELSGKTRYEALNGSEDSNDINFLNDMEETKKMYEALNKGNVQEVKKIRDQLANAGVDPNNIYPARLLQQLREVYPSYWEIKSEGYDTSTLNEDLQKTIKSERKGPGVMSKLGTGFGDIGNYLSGLLR